MRKSNIEIVKGYLAGERPFIRVGYTPPTVVRKEGEEWVDGKGQHWRQTNGGKVSFSPQAEMIRTLSKQKCACGQDIRFGNRLDEKFFLKTGKCYDCIINEEHRLRLMGVYPFYEQYKMLSNYLGFLEDMRQKIKDSIKYFESESDTLSVLCNSEGFIEKFRGMNTTDLLVAAKKDLKEITEAIAKVTKDKKKSKKLYESELAKAEKKLAQSK